MNRNLKDLVDEVKSAVDITEIIGEMVSLDKNLKGRCSFHDDKTPSLSVNRQGQYFHCFGCGVGGDVISFVEMSEGKSFWEALKSLAFRAGVALESIQHEDKTRMDQERVKRDILFAVAHFYHSSLDECALDYLRNKRGFSDETIEHFLIGSAHGGLRDHLIQTRKFDLELCLKAGVLKKSDNGEIRDYFYNRVVFPHLS